MTNTTRTVVQNYNNEQLQTMFDKWPAMGERYWAALGRLSWWGSDSASYCHVDVSLNVDDGMIFGVYRSSATGEANFTLAAVWDESSDSFSFHS